MDMLFSRYRNAMLLVGLLFLQLVMLAFQVKRERDVPLIRVWAVNLMTPMERAASGSVRNVVGVWHNYFELRGARDESRRLSEEVARLKLSTAALQEEASEARRLKVLLNFRETTPLQTIVAHVIGLSLSENSRILWIDRGMESGVRKNMPVITPDGIVGKVQRAYHGSSQVLAITDSDSGAGVLLAGTRVQGSLKGVNGSMCEILYIVNDEKVEAGDKVYTSGEDFVYPKGLPVGTVTAVKPGPVFKQITVQPAAQIARLEEVLVVTKGVNQDIPVPQAPEPAQVAADIPIPVRPPQPAAGSAAARPAAPGPETDADKVIQAYRATKGGIEDRARNGLLVPTRSKPLDETAPGAGGPAGAAAPHKAVAGGTAAGTTGAAGAAAKKVSRPPATPGAPAGAAPGAAAGTPPGTAAPVTPKPRTKAVSEKQLLNPGGTPAPAAGPAVKAKPPANAAGGATAPAQKPKSPPASRPEKPPQAPPAPEPR